MPVITYTAKRAIEKLAYLKVGSDISVAAGDDSFNATVTSLAGLVLDNYVLSSGFANAANNGWFHVSASSTSTKILQDTTASLVTEAAGPIITLQGYKRGLGVAYSLQFNAEEITRSGDIDRSDHVSLGGANETILRRIDVLWQIKTAALPLASMPQFREIMHSIAARETFTLDPYGTIAVPDSPVACFLEPKSYTEEREGTGPYFRIAFRAREI